MIPSIQKIIVLAIIMWLVWMAFKFFDKRSSNIKNNKANDNLEMMKCAECGVWIEDNICKNPKCRSSN